MHCMWAALVLLLLYMLTVFLGSRVLDIVLWCTTEQGRQLVDPFLLSVRQLKQLLETRGVSHTGYIEKQELAQLVQDSADVTTAEVSELSAREQEKLSSTSDSFEFTGSAHFYEQVEDTKDSVWLVQVIPAGRDSQQAPLLDDYTWKFVHNHVAPFAVRTGIFNCNYGRRLCRSKGWFEPLLLLALPRGTKPKDRVVLRTSQLNRPQAIIEWLREELSIRVHKISDVEELEKDWLTDSSSKSSRSSNDLSSSEVKVLLLTHLIHPPLFLAALSIKFTGRIKFGMFTLKKDESESLKKRVGRTPSYVITTPEGVTIYGQRKGEHFNFKSMNTFLRSIQPEINDIFLCSLLFVNMIVLLQILQVSVDLWWKKIVSTLWIIVSHNLFLFWVWIFVFGIRRWPLFGVVTDSLLVFVRYFWMSQLGTFVRSDCQVISSHPVLFIISFILFGYVAKQFVSFRSSSTQTQQGTPDQRTWWEVLPLDCLFRPISTSPLSSSTSHIHPYVPMPGPGPFDTQLEEGIEMLIERLAVPNLWLQSHSHNSDYIKDLPVWKVPSPTDEPDEEVLLRMMDSNGNSDRQPAAAACGEDCAVCLEGYQIGETLCGLPCGHCYHHQCLMLWLQTDNHHCPICRWPAYKTHPHQHKYHNQ
ncbi:E3 ubiquitin-protein ligase RNF103-like [Lycorma delicatula]|uniref:E3 ubiquitin-protein ligase RNF103-like n=1 Tax=Lycorma delicatula TaxID=130591 RepID=UPI003F50F8CB